MDFHIMKRKELQALCKQRKIPANLSNLEMAKKLAECFEEIENSANQGLKNGQGENACETESTNMVANKKVKKVRFSPEHELIEFTRSPSTKGRIRRNSVSVRASISSVENDENVDRQGRFTRSRGTALIEEHIVENKRRRKGVNCSDERKKENLDNGGLGDGCVDGTIRVLRSRGISIVEGIDNAKGNENALDGVNDGKSVEEIVDTTVRVTRSRCQKLTEGTLTETKRVRKLVEIVGDVVSASGEADAKRMATRRSSRKGVEINGKQQDVSEGEADTKRVATRRSSRKGVEINGKQQEVLEGEADANRVATRLLSGKGVEISGKQQEVLEDESDVKRVAIGEISVDDGKSIEEIVDTTVRVTRSRCQKLTEGTLTETKRVRKLVEIVGDVVSASGEADVKIMATRRSSRKGVEINGKQQDVSEGEADTKRVATRRSSRKGVEINGKQQEVLEGEADANRVATRLLSGKGVEISGKQQEVLEDESDVKRVATRLSFRKGVEINGKRSEEVLENTEKIEELNRTIAPQVLVRSSKRNATTVGNSQIFSKGSRKSEILSTTDVNAENGISKGECDESILPTINPVVRRSNRIKDLVVVHEKGRNADLKEETENTRQLRSLAPQSVISGRVPKNQKKMPQPPIEIMRPSRRKTLIPVNCEAEKHLSKEFPVEKGPSAVLNNTRRSRRVASMCKPVQVTDERGGDSIVQQRNAARKREIGPISEEEEVVKVDNDLGSLKQSVEESINKKAISIAEVQLSLSDGALSSSNPGLSSDTKNKSITRKTHTEEQVVSIADSSKSTEMDFVGSNVLANTANLEKDIPASNIKDEENVDSLEFDVQDIIEQDITNMVKNQFEVHLCCQMKGSSCVNTTDDQIFHEDTNVFGIESFVETISSVNSDLLVDLEMTKAEADTYTQAGPIVVGEVEGISVLDNLDLVEIRPANVLSLTNACHQNTIDPMEASNRISDDKKEDRALKAQEVDASESCEKGDEGALQRMDPSSATARSIELEETYTQKGIVPELEEIEKGGSLMDKNTESHNDDEFSMPGLFGGERSVGMTPEDRGVMSGEYSTMNSDEQVMDKESLSVSTIITSPNNTNICLERDLETEHSCQGEESYIDKNTHYDVAEIDEGRSPDCHGDEEFVMSNIHKITPQDREILSGENSIKHQRVEGDEAFARKDNQLESSENNEGGCSKNHKVAKDEEFGFSVNNLFDGEESSKITPQVRGVFSPQDSSKGFNEQVVFDDFHVVSTMYNEFKISAGASSLKEISPPEPNTSHKSQGDEAHQISNLADEHTTEYTHTQVEQQNSPSPMPTAIQGQEAFNDVSETTGSAMCISQTCGKGITSLVLDESNTNEDEGQDKYEFADEFMKDADISMDCSVGKLGDERFCGLEFHYTEETEYQPKNLHEKHIVSDVGEKPNDVKHSQSWTGIELNNLFETTMNGTGHNSLTNMKEREMEREITSESAKTTHKKSLFSTNYKEVSVSNATSGVDREDNQLKLLFETPMMIASPSEVDETSSHEEKPDIADVSIAECVDTTMDNSAAQIMSDEKVPAAEDEFESSLFLGCSSDNGEEINYEELNEVERVELVNASTVVLCEASMVNMTENTCDECLKRSDFITEKIRDEKVITLGEATENDSELREGYTISSTNSDDPEICQDIINTDLLENLDFENRVSPKSERKSAPSSGAEFELSGADIQRSNELQNSHHPTGSYEENNLSELLIDTLKEGPMDAEVANIVCCVNGEEDAENKGTSPGLFPKASNDGDEVTLKKYETENDDGEAKIWDEKDDDSRSIDDISDESQCTSEVEKLKSPSVRDTLEFLSTCKLTRTTARNLDNTLPVAEENEIGDNRKSEAGTHVPNSVGDHEATDYETGDIKKSDSGIPLFNLEDGDHEKKNDKEVEEKSAATIVKFPISELRLEEEILESNKDVPAAAFGCNEFLKESDVDNTMKEYINSELARMNEMAPCEDGLQSVESLKTECKHREEAICVDNVHVQGEEQAEQTLFKESLRGPDAASVDMVGDSGSGGNDASLLQKEDIESKEDVYVISTSGELCLTAKKNARTILIHGTPSKVMATADTKENAPILKSANVVDFTAPRPAKRKALQDARWK